ncbi:MAG TPA: ankyrin repeat domain-containing protein, partial [Labilithrix sp.]|nr:ankyrin repeat domain-containing protein [Labilithrix sp.]
ESCQLVIHKDRGKHPGEAELVGVLAEAKVPLDLHRKAPRGWLNPFESLFKRLVRAGKEDVVEAYLAHGLPVDSADDEGQTLLMLAVDLENLSLARKLLKHGADPRVKDKQGRGVIERASKKLDKARVAVLNAACDPELTTPEARVAAFDRAEEKRAKVEAEAKRAREAEVAAIQRAYSEKVQKRYEEEQRREASRPKPEAPSRSSSVPDLSNVAPICETPEIRACRERGRSCEQCFHDQLKESLKGVPRPSGPVSCPASYKACGGVCCGSGYVCCVGATSSNFGAETCRLSSVGCKQGWDAERVK